MKYRIKVEIDGNGNTTYTPQFKSLLWWKRYWQASTYGWDRVIDFQNEPEALKYLDRAKYRDSKNIVTSKYYKPYP